MHRREFLASSAASAVSAAAWLAGCAPRRSPGAAGATGPSGGTLVFVGTYTEGTASRGVYGFRADPDTGAWTALGTSDVGPNPSFLAVHPNGRVLYAVNEVARDAGQGSSPPAEGLTGDVRALAIDRATGALTPMGEPLPTGGGDPCYVSVDATGRLLMVANYGSARGGSVAAFRLAADGRPEARTYLDRRTGSGPRTERQAAPHAHCVIAHPGNRWAVSADLGADQVMVHALDPRTATLATAGAAATRPGAGPRHLAFHPSGRTLYALGELDLTLIAFPFDPAAGTLGVPEVLPLLAAAQAPPGSTAADLHVHPAGRALYASIRGDDSLVRFTLDPASGRPTFADRVPSGGRRPRNFALDPSVRFLYAANQTSGTIVPFAVGAGDGRLTPAGPRVEVPAPVCVVFA